MSNESQQPERSLGFDGELKNAEEVQTKRGDKGDEEKNGRRRATTRQIAIQTAGLTSFDQ